MALRIIIRQAHFLKDLDFLTNMDPYVVVYIGGSRQRTPTCHNAGKHPRWESALSMPASDYKMKIEVWDQDVSNDDLIGQATLDLAKYYGSPNIPFNEVVQTDRYGKKSGNLTVQIQYEGPANQGKVALNKTLSSNPYIQQQTNGHQQLGVLQQQHNYKNKNPHFEPQQTLHNQAPPPQPYIGNMSYRPQLTNFNQPPQTNQMLSSYPNSPLYPSIYPEHIEAKNRIQTVFGPNQNMNNSLSSNFISHMGINTNVNTNYGPARPPPLPPGLNPTMLGMNLMQTLAMNDWDPNFTGR